MNRDGSGLRRLTNQPEHRHHADLVAVRHADRVHLRSHRHAADLRRRRRRAEPLEEDVGVVLRPADLVAGAVQRDRVRRAHRPGLRHQGASTSSTGATQVADLRRGHQREPGVLAERPPPRVHVDALGQDADLHDGARRQERAADHARPATTTNRTGPNDWRIDDESGPIDSHAGRGVAALITAVGLRQENAARRAADAAAAAGDGDTDAGRGRRRRPNRSREPVSRAARAGARRRDLVGVARRSEPELAAEAGVLRAATAAS